MVAGLLSDLGVLVLQEAMPEQYQQIFAYPPEILVNTQCELEEKLVGIAPKTPEQASLSMTQSQVNRLGLFSMFGLPILAIILGVWVWYRRRD